jgi:hypothetical protein
MTGVWTRIAGFVLCLVLLCSCSQQSAAKDDLIHALTEAHTAIASSLLALELYDQQRSTQAVTETLLGDMTKQAVDAERALESVSVDSERSSLIAMKHWPQSMLAWQHYSPAATSSSSAALSVAQQDWSQLATKWIAS